MELERRIGTVLRGKWTLERLLGAGGMAAVYAGVHKIGRRDAIKILHPEVASEPELRARFDQEAYAVNRFVHPGAVEIRDVDVSEDGCPFLVMELLEGESLGARCSRLGAPSIAETLRIADDLLDVLAAAHAQGIIHRDIKPDNVFCLSDGRIKVLDFGVARVRQAAQQFRTKTGATLGTVTYMPPEQVKGMHVDARADVFAVGATLFRLIAQRRIHEGRSEAELLVKMATQPAPPLASVAPGTPPWLCAIVDRALAFDREARYPDAKTMQNDIRALRNGQPPAFALRTADAAQAPTALLAMRPHDDATLVDVRGAWALTQADAPIAPAAPAGPPHVPAAPAAPPYVPHQVQPAQPTRFPSQRTQWTVTSLGEKRLRWALLVFPLLGAAVLALIFYWATHVEKTGVGTEKTAGTPRAISEPNAQAIPASKLNKAEPVAPVVMPPDPVTQEAEQRAHPEPAPTLAPAPNCFLTNDCDSVCEDECHAKCQDRNGCKIGATHGAEVHCSGPGPCVISCAGKCEVKCDRYCLVQCTPGFDCALADCPTKAEKCSPFVLACGVPCPE